MSEYTLQREAGVKPSNVKFSVINSDGPRDIRLGSLLNGYTKMFTAKELYQVCFLDTVVVSPIVPDSKMMASTGVGASNNMVCRNIRLAATVESMRVN